MPVLEVGESLPDQADFNNPGSGFFQTNVYPRTKTSYGPMPTPQVYSSALTARCQGAYAFVDATSAPNIFAGDATKLYRMTAGSAPSFSDVSRTVGGAYTTGSPVNPAIPTMPGWCMTSYGERIIATNYSDAVQTFLIGTDANFSALAAGAPKARFVAVIKDFLFLGNTTDAVYGAKPRRAWWSAIGLPTSFPTPATNAAIQVQSDFQDLEQSDLGQMTGLVGGHLASSDGAAFMESGIYRIDYVGSRDGIFSFKVAEGAAGTSAPLSIVTTRVLGRTAAALYLGPDGFYAYDGASSTSIGFDKIDRTFFAELDPNYLSAVQGVSDPNLPLVYWLYHAGTTGAFYDRMLVYNTILGRWSRCNLTATPAEGILRTVTIGSTLDALDTFGSLDAVPAPLGSGIWVGNRPRLSIFDNSHKLNHLTGSSMAATVQTSEAQPNPGLRSRIAMTRPDVDGGTPSVSVGVRERLKDSVTYKAAVPINAIGECPQRVTGRYVRMQITVPAGDIWNHISGVEVSAPVEGRR